jgi:hypothetical protein
MHRAAACLLALALALPATADGVASDPTGQVMPPIARPNALLDGADKLTVVAMMPPEGFEAALAKADVADVVGKVIGMEEAGSAEFQVAVFFVKNWQQAGALARAIESPEMLERYEAAEEDDTVVRFQAELSDGAVEVFTIATGHAEPPVPVTCHARLVVAALYDPEVEVDLQACAESLLN